MVYIMKDSKYRDAKGEKIWFPKDEKPYYDVGLGKTFHNIKEKATYMKEKGIIMDGSSDKINKPVEAGDARFKRVR